MGTWNRANDEGNELGIGKVGRSKLGAEKQEEGQVWNRKQICLEKGIRRRRSNLENTVEDMWALGTINKQEKDELGNGKCGSGLEKGGDEKSDPGIGKDEKIKL